MTPQKLRCQVNKITDHVYTVDLAPERPLPSFKPGQCVLRFRKVEKTFADLIKEL